MEELTAFFSEYWLQTIIAVLAAYLISSVNTSIIVTRIVLHKDIRSMGSGNAGFTNVLRCVGKAPAIVTFIGDFLKGIISVTIAYFLMFGVQGANADIYRGYLMYIAGLFAVVGHTFPIYYKFKGGKGVVTTFAVMFMTDWRMSVMALLIFAVFFMITGIISVCALINAVALPVNTIVFKFLDYNNVTAAISPMPSPSISFILFSAAITFIIGLLVIFRHKENIQRLANGTEKKIKAKK